MITKWAGVWVELDEETFQPIRNLSHKEIEQYKRQMIDDWHQWRLRHAYQLPLSLFTMKQEQ